MDFAAIKTGFMDSIVYLMNGNISGNFPINSLLTIDHSPFTIKNEIF